MANYFKPYKPQKNSPHKLDKSKSKEPSSNITQEIISEISSLKQGLSHYEIRKMVAHAEQLGTLLSEKGLKTNQIRKFLDALNRLKFQSMQSKSQRTDVNQIFVQIKTDIILLKPKLAYAATREGKAAPLKDVISEAVDKTLNLQDFERLVQFVESIVAYHKAAGGRSQ